MLSVCALLLAAFSYADSERVEPLKLEREIWEGVYTEDQAQRGEQLYLLYCASCHLDNLTGDGDSPALVARAFYVRWSELSVADFISVLRSTMPKEAPNSLGLADYVEISAYILKANGVSSGDVELPDDIETLLNVVITTKSE